MDDSLSPESCSTRSHPLFPPLRQYGPPTWTSTLRWTTLRITSFFLSLTFLMALVIGAFVTSIPPACKGALHFVLFQNSGRKRPFEYEENLRAKFREEQNEAWKQTTLGEVAAFGPQDEFKPTEGGKDPIVCDVGYYARRVGLDVQVFEVQTEDFFVIDLCHVYDPAEASLNEEAIQNDPSTSDPTPSEASPADAIDSSGRRPKFPVLLMHGLLQSSGAYCCNDDDSLAFWLCKSGYDVWLGNNRCGFKPKHVLFKHSDPRMWSWNIRHMGVFDLPALVDKVLLETGFKKIGLICHSQGTTEALVALAKDQRPDLGQKLSVFCALAPAAYAGPLIEKVYFKFMRMISPAAFRLVFGIHAFIPFMMQMHSLLDPRLYGWIGGLRNRMFQFAPVYVSAESMMWWLGRGSFANHKCILATKEVLKVEDEEDKQAARLPIMVTSAQATESGGVEDGRGRRDTSTAWYDEQVPPFALWVCGNDDLVDGRRLLKRLTCGREPHVEVVHARVLDEYEHLDVIWAIDAPEQVFGEISEVLWRTCNVKDVCRIPKGFDVSVHGS